MKLSINTESLKRELAFLKVAVEQKTTIPILANVLIDADQEGLLALQSYNLDIYCSTSVQINVHAKVGELIRTCIPYSQFAAFVEHAHIGQIFIETTKARKGSIGATVVITSGPRKLELETMSASNWPQWPAEPSDYPVAIESKEFLSLASKVSFAMAREDSRYAVNGALFECEHSSINMVATNGHRLAWAKGKPLSSSGKAEWILPACLIRNLPAILNADELKLGVGDSHIYLSCGNRTIAVANSKAKFPNWRTVIRETTSAPSAEVDSQVLLAELNAASTFLDPRSHALYMNFRNGRLNPDTGYCDGSKYNTSVPLVQSNGELRICFNALYIRDLCEHIQGNLQMFFKDSASSAVFKSSSDDSVVYVVMPMRI